MTLPVNIRVNVKANFPTQVNVSGPLSLSKANGVWSFGMSFKGLAAPANFGALSAYQLVAQDPVAGTFYAVTASLLFGLGALAQGEAAQGGTYPVSPTGGDYCVVAGSAATTTFNLEPSATAQRPHSFIDTVGNAGSVGNNIVINANGAEKIVGLSSVSIATDFGALTLYPLPQGGGWYIK
jgi:hypothetical protein